MGLRPRAAHVVFSVMEFEHIERSLNVELKCCMVWTLCVSWASVLETQP